MFNTKFLHFRRSIPKKTNIHKFIKLLNRGFEIEIIKRNYRSLDILRLDKDGYIHIIKNNDENNSVILQFDKLHLWINKMNNSVSIFDTNNNEINCILKFNIAKSAEIFTNRYLELLDYYKDFNRTYKKKNNYEIL